MALEDFGVEDGAVAEEEMIHMILHHLIQVTHVESLHQVERHLVSDKRAGDLGFGLERWEVRLLGIWLATGQAGTKRGLSQGRVGLAVTMAMGWGPALAHDLVQGPVRALVLLPDTKARGLAQHLGDKRICCKKF
jgi:hypothetical protein